MTRKESPPGAPAPRGLFCPQKPPLTEGKVSTGVGVMVGRMCFARMFRCAAMAGTFSASLCSRARSAQGNIIEFVQLMNEKDSRKVVRLFRRQVLPKI